MKKLKFIVAPILALSIAFSSFLITFANEKNSVVSSFSRQENGVFVLTDNNYDFPPAPNLTKSQFEYYAEALVSDAKSKGINTIYYDAVSYGKAAYKSKVLPIKESIFSEPQNVIKGYDPLEILIKKAEAKGVLVVATINPIMVGDFAKATVKYNNFTNSKDAYDKGLKVLSDISAELSNNYKISGILITKIFETDIERDTSLLKSLKDVVLTVYNSTKQSRSSVSVGVLANSSKDTKSTFAEFLKSCNPYCDYFIFNVKDSNENFYEAQVKYWSKFCRENEKDVFFLSNISNYKKPMTISNEDIPDVKNLDSKIFINTQHNASGTVFDSYKSLIFDLDSSARQLAVEAKNKEIYSQSINKNKYKLEINYPYEDEFVTDKDEITILGSSDPSETLYINGSKIKVTNTNGFFAHTAKLNEGKNIFYFNQGSEKQKLTINYDKSKKQFECGQAFPKYNEPVFPGEMLKVKITALRGKDIKVNFRNKLYPLEEREYVENVATYVGTIPIPELSDGMSEENLGKLYYSISDGEKVYNVNSDGSLILMKDKKSNETNSVRGKINSIISPIYTNPYDKIEIGSLCYGTEVVIDDLTEEYAFVSEIGYLSRKDIDIFYSDDDGKNEIINVALNSENDKDILAVIGTKNNGYRVNLDENKVVLKLIDAIKLPDSLAHLESEFLESIDVNAEKGTITLTLNKGNKLLGCNVHYDDNLLILELLHTPKISNSALPLEGINILIDAAGSGTKTDPKCADGMPIGTYNLMTAYMLNYHLKALGANVYMTRTETDNISVYDRTSMATNINPHLIISVNNDWSATLSENENQFKISYDLKNHYSLNFAESLKNSIETKIKINSPILEEAPDGKIISSHSCPSISVSFGNMFNPDTYSTMTDSLNIHKVIYALGSSIIEIFEEIWKTAIFGLNQISLFYSISSKSSFTF